MVIIIHATLESIINRIAAYKIMNICTMCQAIGIHCRPILRNIIIRYAIMIVWRIFQQQLILKHHVATIHTMSV